QPRFDISPDEAIDLVAATARLSAAGLDRCEEIPVALARGRVLRKDDASLADRPTGNDSALDGFACLAADTASATLDGAVHPQLGGAAGADKTFAGTVPSGQALWIARGAGARNGADPVIGVRSAGAVGGSVRVFR